MDSEKSKNASATNDEEEEEELPTDEKAQSRILFKMASQFLTAMDAVAISLVGLNSKVAPTPPPPPPPPQPAAKDLKLPTLSKRDPVSWRSWRQRVDNYLIANRWTPEREVEMIFCALSDEALRATGTFQRPKPGAQVAFKKADGTVVTRPFDGRILLDRLEQQCFITEQTEEYNRMLLESIHQRHTENIPDLAARYKEQFLLAWPEVVQQEGTQDALGRTMLVENNKQLIHGFLSAINNAEVAEWAKAFKPTSFTKAIQLAAHKEASLYALKNKPKAAAAPKPPAFMQEMAVEEASLQAMGGSGFRGNCHLCSEPQHSWRNCPMVKKYHELSNKRPALRQARQSEK